MAALPPESTRRWWAVYTVNGATHRMLMRTVDTQEAVNANVAFDTIFTQLSTQLNTVQVQNLEMAVKGSNVRNTFAWTGPISYGAGTQSGTDVRARSWSFVGRSTLGHKSRFTIFGPKDIGEGDYRVDVSESAVVQTIVNTLNGAVGVFIAVDGSKPVWKGYANIDYNDHWIKVFRKLGG